MTTIINSGWCNPFFSLIGLGLTFAFMVFVVIYCYKYFKDTNFFSRLKWK